MIAISKQTDNTYVLHYVKTIDNDTVQMSKFNLTAEDVAQYLGNN